MLPPGPVLSSPMLPLRCSATSGLASASSRTPDSSSQRVHMKRRAKRYGAAAATTSGEVSGKSRDAASRAEARTTETQSLSRRVMAMNSEAVAGGSVSARSAGSRTLPFEWKISSQARRGCWRISAIARGRASVYWRKRGAQSSGPTWMTSSGRARDRAASFRDTSSHVSGEVEAMNASTSKSSSRAGAFVL